MEDKDGTFCPAEQQPKAFPETETGLTGESVHPSAPLQELSPHHCGS